MKQIFSIFLIFICLQGFSQNAPKYSNEFLHLGAGASAVAQSNSIISRTNSVYSGYWNPAGLVHVKNLEVGLQHSYYFGGIANYDFLAVGISKDDEQAFGISMVRVGVDNILNTYDLIRNGEIDYNRVTTFSAVDYAFIFSYARKQRLRNFPEMELSWGSNAKILYRKAGDFASAYGFGLDAGLIFNNPERNWSFGVMVRDITSSFTSWDYNFTDDQKDLLVQQGNTVPINTLEISLPRILLGISKTIEKQKYSISGEVGLDWTWDGKRNVLLKTNLFSMAPHFGAEYNYYLGKKSQKLSLRAGMGNFQQEVVPSTPEKKILTLQPNIGFGLKLGNVSINYALSDIGDQSAVLTSHMVSLKIDIQPKNSK